MPGFSIGGIGSGPSNVIETSRRNRYRVRIMGPLSRDLLFYAHKVTIPPSEIDQIKIHHRQEEIYLPGKGRFGTLTIKFYKAHDNGGDMAAREVAAWRAKVLDMNRSSLVGAGPGGSAFRRNAAIDELDGSDAVAYSYLVYGAWPHKVTQDQFDFGDSSIAEVELILSVDKMLEVAGTSSGAATEACGFVNQATALPPGPPAPVVATPESGRGRAPSRGRV